MKNFEDFFDVQQPVQRESKPFQSSFESEDMASLYGGRERGMRQFSGAAGTIEVEDFKKRSSLCGMSSESQAIPPSILSW